MATKTVPSKADFHALVERDPVRFCREVLGFSPWSKQAEILRSVREHKHTAVRAANGVGKTTAAAHAALWFLLAYPDSIVITTAPTWAQVKDAVWKEIHKILYRAPAGLYEPANQTRLDMAPGWYAVGLSTDTAERFAGYHSEHLLLVVDEASGVTEDIYAAAEGFMTADGGRVLLIGNPTQNSGQFHRCFHSERAIWRTIHISAFDSPNFTDEDVPAHVKAALTSRDSVETKRAKFGEDSIEYQVRVLGEFPSSSENQVIDLRAIEAAFAREVVGDHAPVILACDIAEFGDDETVIFERVGNRGRIVRTHYGKSLMETCGAIMECRRDLSDRGMDCTIVVDAVGIGAGVAARLKELGCRVERFGGGDSPADKRLYRNRRSEAWFLTREQLPDLAIEADAQLLADLTSTVYELDSAGRRVVEPKKATKKRLGRSPDRADALLMAFAGGAPMGADFVDSAWLDGDD
jgi:hypothetical protein